MLSSIFPTPRPTTRSWILLRVWREPFSFSCAYMYTYIILPLKKNKIRISYTFVYKSILW